MSSLRGKVSAITGASSGIGRALAVVLARRGGDVALADVDDANLEETARLVRAEGARATTARLDVADRDAVHAWAGDVVRDHGRCHAVFNNAGVGYGATIEGSSYADLEWIIGINFWGVVHGTKAFLPHLRASGDGHVVNISSLFGLISVPGQGAYNASKFAVRGFTEALRMELEATGAPVTATCVHPGGVKTNIARAARASDSLKSLGVPDPERGYEQMEKLFRTTPEQAAETIVRGVERKQRRVLVGTDAKLIDLAQRVLPARYQWFVTRATARMASQR